MALAEKHLAMARDNQPPPATSEASNEGNKMTERIRRAKRTTAIEKKSKGFTDEERAAMSGFIAYGSFVLNPF
jgi:hypothetical protein